MIVALQHTGCFGVVWACNGDRDSAAASTRRRLAHNPALRRTLVYAQAECHCALSWTGRPATDACGTYALDAQGCAHAVDCVGRFDVGDSVVVSGISDPFVIFRKNEWFGVFSLVAPGVVQQAYAKDMMLAETCFE